PKRRAIHLQRGAGEERRHVAFFSAARNQAAIKKVPPPGDAGAHQSLTAPFLLYVERPRLVALAAIEGESRLQGASALDAGSVNVKGRRGAACCARASVQSRSVSVQGLVRADRQPPAHVPR